MTIKYISIKQITIVNIKGDCVMIFPPKAPLVKGNKDINYFQQLAMLVSPCLKEYGITLNFQGFTELIDEYQDLKFNDAEKAWELAMMINSWSDYFSSLSNVVQKIMLDSETDWLKAQAIKSIRHDVDKVSNGNRFSNKDKDVIRLRKKRNVLKAFYDELQAKVRFLERAYYHCKATYELGRKTHIESIFGK